MTRFSFKDELIGLIGGVTLTIGLTLWVSHVLAADSPKPALPVETLRNDTAGLLVINVSGKVVGFVFVSHTGQILPERSEACEAKDECRTLVRGLIESGKVTTVYAGEQPSPVT